MEKPMAPDERDRMFDKALARHLRSAPRCRRSFGYFQPFRFAEPRLPGPGNAGGAYHERSLLPEQLNS